MLKALIPIFILFNLYVEASSQSVRNIYKQAFEEQKAMLEGSQKINFKRAVFLTENAFHADTLDYKQFCQKISSIAFSLKELIKQRGLQKYKTAGNWAVYLYLKDTTPVNNKQPYLYDFDDFMGEKDYTKMFVTKLLKSRTGNCHSLPYLYKILCEEIGASAHLVLAPNHIYIKHIDEKGQWANIELTSGGFPRDQWVIKQMAITVEAIKNEAYMKALTQKESISLCLFDLADAYEFQNGYDDFSLEIIETALKYFPNSIPILMSKANNLKALYDKNRANHSSKLKSLHYEYKKVANQIDSLGHKDIPIEVYEEWVKSNEKKNDNTKH